MRASLPAAVVAELRQSFGDRFQEGRAIRDQHAATTTWLAPEPPDAVVFARSTEEVATVIRLCAREGIPVIPFGAGTSLEGQVNAPFGGISLDLSQMNRILAVHAEDMDAVVQPGVTRTRINTHLRDTGLFFPLDPGADASLGGMAATRASGTTAVRYGTMRDAVLALEAVMPDGSVIRSGSRARKSAAGYDLTRLLIGAEGTLGVITELTLRLQPVPEAITALSCSFPTVPAACEAVIAALGCAVPVARIELMDQATVRAVNAYSGTGLADTPLLIAEFHGSVDAAAEAEATFRALAEEYGGHDFRAASTTEERNRLWKARHDVFWAVSALRPGARGISTDVCVPVSRLADCIAAAEAKVAEVGLVAPIAGHVGDGNFHHLILVDPNDTAECARAEDHIGWLNDLALSMEGTCTGEHGIGQGKRKYLEREAGPALHHMAAIKAALDPGNIMNPGKILGVTDGRGPAA
ncbi:FAD-binding oxidoreductase [Defluviimonas sp. SAOS-178_SWC]|uniref:FAD-binding oxidoreductase n=1 Tax=Defluviimonas sp. SAOS-178_SWC TaxID=3121287 RepID=UPI003221AEC9